MGEMVGEGRGTGGHASYVGGANNVHRAAEAAASAVHSRGGGVKGRIARTHGEGDLVFDGLGVRAGWEAAVGDVELVDG